VGKGRCFGAWYVGMCAFDLRGRVEGRAVCAAGSRGCCSIFVMTVGRSMLCEEGLV
jgi:hypothetical protein